MPRRSTTSDDLDLYTHFVWWVPARRTHGAPQHAVNSCGPFQFPLVTSDMTVWISSRMHYCEPLIEGRRLTLLTGPCTGRGMPSGHAMCVSSRHTPSRNFVSDHLKSINPIFVPPTTTFPPPPQASRYVFFTFSPLHTPLRQFRSWVSLSVGS